MGSACLPIMETMACLVPAPCPVDHLPKTQAHHLPGGLPTIVEAIECEGPLLAVVLLHRDVALQRLQDMWDRGRWGHHPALGPLSLPPSLGRTGPLMAPSSSCPGWARRPINGGPLCHSRGASPTAGEAPRLCGATLASLGWICSDTFLVHHPLSQSLQTLEAQASFAVTPPTG